MKPTLLGAALLASLCTAGIATAQSDTVTATFIGHGYEDHSFNEFTFYADLDVAPGMTFSEVVLTFDYALLQGDLPPGPQVVSEAYALVFQRERSDATENSLGPIVTVVPEPATLAMPAIAALAARRRRPA